MDCLNAIPTLLCLLYSFGEIQPSRKFSQSGEECEGELNPGAPSPFLIIANKISKGPVILNVGGKRHEVNVTHEYETFMFGQG